MAGSRRRRRARYLATQRRRLVDELDRSVTRGAVPDAERPPRVIDVHLPPVPNGTDPIQDHMPPFVGNAGILTPLPGHVPVLEFWPEHDGLRAPETPVIFLRVSVPTLLEAYKFIGKTTGLTFHLNQWMLLLGVALRQALGREPFSVESPIDEVLPPRIDLRQPFHDQNRWDYKTGRWVSRGRRKSAFDDDDDEEKREKI